jgi:hypothetical protein
MTGQSLPVFLQDRKMVFGHAPMGLYRIKSVPMQAVPLRPHLSLRQALSNPVSYSERKGKCISSPTTQRDLTLRIGR